MRRRMLIIGSIALVLLVGVSVFLLLRGLGKSPENILQNDLSIVDKATLSSFPQKAGSNAWLERIDDDIDPPTNSWISGLALQEKPMAVYPMPLSFKANDGGFEMGLPKVISSPAAITGGHAPGLVANIQNASNFRLSRFDKTSAALTYMQNSTELARVTIAQGSPYVFYRSLSDSRLSIDAQNIRKISDTKYQFGRADAEYSIVSTDAVTINANNASLTISVPKNELVTMYTLPAESEDILNEFALNEITSVEISPKKQGDVWQTEFKYVTENNKPTAVSFFPYTAIKNGTTPNVSYESIYGDMNVWTGTTFTAEVPLLQASGELDIKNLNNQEKEAIIKELDNDATNTTVEPQDTYFAGKRLARLANLLSLAKQLDQDDIAERLQSALKTELSKRLNGQYFYYDTELKGIAAQTAAFGSEDFNDHHFHYGYFIYAAAILGRYDDSFTQEYKDAVNLLVADIASYEQYEEFPRFRNFDSYAGHSWAAGLAPFEDGNNQESSSEALNAWNAVSLWGELTGNKTLSESGQWMLSNEAHTAQTAWRSVNTSADYLKNYTSPVASLSFGGKRTYSTFFSDESNAKLGIQLIPMSPVMQSFSSDGDGIKQKLATQAKQDDYNVALGDYLLMYLALADKKAALDKLSQQQNAFIDDGNSRSYMRAWMYLQ